MNKYLFFGLSMLISLSLFAQKKGQIKAVSPYLESITPNDLEAHIGFLADDLLEGRETGQRGQHLAGLYLAQQFKKMGLAPGNPTDNSYYQRFYMVHTYIDYLASTLGDSTYGYRKDYFSFAADALPEELKGDLVFAGYGLDRSDFDNLSTVDLKDKIALFFADEPEGTEMSLRAQVSDWQYRVEQVQEKGGVAALMVVEDEAFAKLKLYAPQRTLNISDGKDPGIPQLCISTELCRQLMGLDRVGYESLRKESAASPKVSPQTFAYPQFSYQAKMERDTSEASNVVGFLEGTDKKEELLIITAHYDHLGIRDKGIYNGADDDGSGTGGLLEIAEAFCKAAAEGKGPRRSILFMPVSGEEKGLLGSKYYTDHPLYPISQTVANLNIDMIGRTDPIYANDPDSVNYVYVIGADKISTELHDINEAVNQKSTRLKLDYKYNDPNDPNRFYYRSDHYNFAKYGIPVIFYFTGTHVDYHQPTDDVAKLHYPKLARITRLVMGTAWEIVNRDKRLIIDRWEE